MSVKGVVLTIELETSGEARAEVTIRVPRGARVWVQNDVEVSDCVVYGWKRGRESGQTPSLSVALHQAGKS